MTKVRHTQVRCIGVDGLKKKLIVILVLAGVILGYSFYNYVQKSSVTEIAPVEQTNQADNADNVNTSANDTVIYVSGAVNKPGVFKISAGSRVLDAINTAGGLAPAADAAKVNMALLVKDEMHIHVPLLNNIDSGVATASAKDGSSGNLININLADKNELDKLPGIGPALADRIIEYRNANGQFKEPSDIKKVSGVGESKYNQIKDKITI
ncbi:MAG TPA: helix-hairpin-helix domain-containing protein [Methylomusa anaerophila]|uniref:ComE operon protein 1 n=1 Tax=Methylomusa anaerophila TaxID=1930071 RepID=A0A348ANW6_9FIRM|nr:helix-hairpin-helix domain-containing protein [Methylomusa anaerophila]BBB92764.1 ComE operon protein 1 [Methylomusa anaerophila]HML87385.1 helix-hairpin-helix domain-containing protein [Methylomusa anaerophila]